MISCPEELADLQSVLYGWETSPLTAGVTAVGIDNLTAFIQSVTDFLYNDC